MSENETYSKTTSSFKELGYAVMRGVLEPQTLQLLATEFEMLKDNLYWRNRIIDGYPFGDPQSPNSFSFYAAPCFEALLTVIKPEVEFATDKQLAPTYSYARIYYNGGTLERHTDRPSCQYSATLCVSNDKDPWPIFIESYAGETTSVDLYPGDMLVYRGDKLNHWREPYQDEKQIQVFVHYTDVNGEYADYAYDQRPMLGLPADTRGLK